MNAFGHPNYKIGAFTVVLLEGISRKHPAMRIVMVEEIERLAFRFVFLILVVYRRKMNVSERT